MDADILGRGWGERSVGEEYSMTRRESHDRDADDGLSTGPRNRSELKPPIAALATG